jgi:hypothetical protein
VKAWEPLAGLRSLRIHSPTGLRRLRIESPSMTATPTAAAASAAPAPISSAGSAPGPRRAGTTGYAWTEVSGPKIGSLLLTNDCFATDAGVGWAAADCRSRIGVSRAPSAEAGEVAGCDALPASDAAEDGVPEGSALPPWRPMPAPVGRPT